MAAHAMEPLVHARRLRAQYIVARGHPAPERLRAKLDAATGTILQEVLAAAFVQYLDPSDDAIWFIRRIDLDFAINADWDRDKVACIWADRIAKTLATILAHGPDGVNAIRFANRIDYLACFLGDLVEERASSRWYYEPFAGLRHLTRSAAIRVAIARDADAGVQALCALPRRSLLQLLTALTQQDARAIVDALADGGGDASVRDNIALVWRAYRATRDTTRPGGEAQIILQLCVEAIRLEPSRSGPALSQAARAICRLVAIADADSALARRIARTLRESGASGFYIVVGPADAVALAPLAESEPDWVDTVVAELTTRETVPSSDEDGAEVRATPFGGAFILLPFLATLLFERATEGLPPSGDLPPAALARLVVLAKMLGGGSLPRLILDPVLLQFLGLPATLRSRQVNEWLAQLPREGLERMRAVLVEATRNENIPPRRWLRQDLRYLELPGVFQESRAVRRAFGRVAMCALRAFAWRLPGFAQSSFAHVRANFLDVAATVETEPTRYVVRLARPPLDIVLNMTGMNRATYRLPWALGRTIALFPDSAL